MNHDGIRLERLTEANFETFASFLERHDKGCYCSFWHQKFSSMEQWDERKAKEPGKNRACMLEKVRGLFHPGVLAYQGESLVGWVSVGPLVDFYWAWRHVARVGDVARSVAAVPCITREKSVRDRIPESALLRPLLAYGRTLGWTAIEGYPFDRPTIEKLGDAVTWAGFPEDFEGAGFRRVEDHWLSSPEHARSIWRAELV